MKKWPFVLGGFLLLLAFPFIWWLLEPKEPLQTLIVDKTVPDESYREHKGLTWLLNYEKYTKANGDPYNLEEDYIGYHPDKKQATALPEDLSEYKMIYLADTYGVYNADLEGENEDGEKSAKIEGGLTAEEAKQIEASLYENPATFIAEFNTFSSPTREEARRTITNLLDIKATGWSGRYFDDLAKDSGGEVPKWAIRDYEEQKDQKWSFDGAGYVLVHNDNTIVVLEEGKDVSDEGIRATFTDQGVEQFGLKKSPHYAYWFDIVKPYNKENVIANYDWELTKEGEEKLNAHNIPLQFPAVTRTTKNDYPAYYFAGDFADMETLPPIHQYKGLASFRKWFSFGDQSNPEPFYWKTYIPMLRDILEEAETPAKSESANPKKQVANEDGIAYPTRVGKERLEIYQDGEWKPTLMKGVNIGMGKPGAFPGEAAITEREYARWFEQIGEMNANAIRVYTLHPPGFYRALKNYNEEADEPIYVFHGAWVDEEPLERHLDSFHEENTESFKNEISTLVDVIHGNATVEEKPGHASGVYNADISEYVIGWIIGIEWYPQMVEKTNENHQDKGDYEGDYIYTENAKPFEHWLASMMDYTIQYEMDQYKWQRPISFTNWPTTDFLDHPSEPLEEEDLVGVNPNVIHTNEDTFKPGMFASYHVYPYYPDFLNHDEEYLSYKDQRGENNSYAGYLHDLVSKHDMPILVAEFGVPGSRGKTHGNPFGWDQGHHSEKQQGNINKRLFEDIVAEDTLGGLVFTWQDEWFKRTWNTMELDNPNRRPFWSNAQTNEQQFGLLSFDRLKRTIDGKGESWKDTKTASTENGDIQSIAADHDERYLYLRLEMSESFQFEDQSLNVAFDTIQNQGIKSIADGLETDEGIDFLLKMDGKDKAELLVDSYYDPFYYQYGDTLSMIEKQPYASEKNNGNFHPIRLALNQQLTVPSTGEVIPFSSYETGKLQHGNADPESEDYNALTDYSIGEKGKVIEVRIPWLLLNIKDPSQKEQMADLWKEGLKGSQSFKDISLKAFTEDNDTVRSSTDFLSYSWKNWNEPKSEERLKKSYDIMKEAYEQAE
ncbi:MULTISPECIES: hypothetical protein [Pontibacillus]|uniref:Glycosyl transferase family 2 n=1 Tax=Pontibacillus chungwhensis TaxID=265426 RepID=A0ABY8UX58_9BACI|nr:MULTISPECIES: hypothetical protein [Pontibacillus]MCD5325876.1 hypothetical protein [Pontibacillus sp. HN14]WIF97587.1 hypothetical protein QNI29_17935 [Pontibacillus chungwhensis]